MQFRVYDRKTFKEITHRVRMDANGAFYIDGGELPLNRLRYFIQFDNSVVLGDGDWETYRNNQFIISNVK